MTLKDTAKSKAWLLAEADYVAERLMVLLAPYCTRIEVAGSIRRRKPLIHDIELLAVPRLLIAYGFDLFGQPAAGRDSLNDRILDLIEEGVLTYRLNKKGSRTFGPLNKLLVHVPSGISVDLFYTTMENYGMAMVVRTGSAQFCVKVMSRLIALGHRGHAYGGITLKGGEELACPTEEIVFQTAGWRYRPPEERG